MTFTLIPAASTSTPSVQVLGFGDSGRLTRCDRLICDFCSSGQCFACGFLQIPPRGGHPCRSASGSPCRVHRGLAPPSHPASTTCTGTAPVKALRAMPGAPQKSAGAFATGAEGVLRFVVLRCRLGRHQFNHVNAIQRGGTTHFVAHRQHWFAVRAAACGDEGEAFRAKVARLYYSMPLGSW